MLKYFLAAAAGALIAVLLLRTCNPAPPTVTNAQQDSVNNVRDSLIAVLRDSVKIEHLARGQNDSARIVQELSKANYEKLATDRIVRLTFERDKFRTALLGRDTSSAVVSCIEYMVQNDSLWQLARGYKFSYDSILTNGADRRAVDANAITLRDSVIAQGNRLFNVKDKQLTVALGERDVFKKQAGKRWGIGPAVGYGVGKGGLTPYAGVSVHYTLFKF